LALTDRRSEGWIIAGVRQMSDQLSNDSPYSSLEAALERLRPFVTGHSPILEAFWNPTRSTFGLESATDTTNHVTTACTCVLSFLDIPGGQLPPFIQRQRSTFIDWLLSARWGSEDLAEHNVYTAPLALTAVAHLDESRLTNAKCVDAVTFLVNEIERSETGGVQFSDYSASGFLTYWALRALCPPQDSMRIAFGRIRRMK
jgi:hypothetical protein